MSGVGKSFNKSMEVETPEHPVLGECNHPISDKTVSKEKASGTTDSASKVVNG